MLDWVSIVLSFFYLIFSIRNGKFPLKGEDILFDEEPYLFVFMAATIIFFMMFIVWRILNNNR